MKNAKKILVVDPDKTWVDKLIGFLNEWEYDPILPASLDTVFQQVSEFDFHVIVTEISFVEYSNDQQGLNLIEDIRNVNDWAEIVIVAKDKYISRGIFKKLVKLGVNPDFILSKDAPASDDLFTSNDFKKIVQAAVRSAEIRRFTHDVFVIMPFADEYKSTYRYIEDASREINLTCRLANESLQENSNEIMEDIEYGITHTRVVVAELSGSNPNVFFEIGVSKALGKPIISIARGKKYLTKMLANWRTTLYKASFDGAIVLSDELKKRLPKEVEKHPAKRHSREPESFVFIATPNTDRGKDTYEDIICPVIDEFSLEHKYIWNTIAKKNFPKEVEEFLRKAAIVIIDLSMDNDDDAIFDPDAFYLAGLAYGCNKKYIFLLDKAQEPPFDVGILSLLRYSKKTRSDREEARLFLKERLSKIYENLGT